MADWMKKKIGDFLTIEYGKPLAESQRKKDGKYPVYGANGIKAWSDKFYCDKKAIVIGRKGSAGEITVTKDKFWPLDVTYFVKFDEKKYDLSFLYYMLSCLDLPSLATGVKPGINRNHIYAIEVHIPNIQEQKRIVAILDQAFADIEKIRVNTEKNLNNLHETIESYLCNIFDKKNCGCIDVLMRDVIDELTDYHANGSYKTLKQHVELKDNEDYAWMVRSTDFENNLENDKRYITRSAYNFLKKSKLFGGELIMSKIGNAGKVYYMPSVNRPCSLAMNLFLIRFNKDKVNSEYVYFYLNSRYGKNEINARLNGTTTLTITKDNVRSLRIPVKSLKNQTLIVQDVKKIKKEIDCLENIYRKKLSALDHLKKSLLQKAFSGQLTQQEVAV